jgi:hypothetical protein
VVAAHRYRSGFPIDAPFTIHDSQRLATYAKSVRHADEIRDRVGLHLRNDLGAVGLDCSFAGAQLMSDLFIESTRCYQYKYFLFPGGQ